MSADTGTLGVVMAAIGTAVAAGYAYKANRHATTATRASSKETNLVTRLIAQEKRSDELSKRLDDSLAAHWAEVELLKSQHSSIIEKMESQHDAKVAKLEVEIRALTELNTTLRQENWLLKHQHIGLEEPPLPDNGGGP